MQFDATLSKDNGGCGIGGQNVHKLFQHTLLMAKVNIVATWQIPPKPATHPSILQTLCPPMGGGEVTRTSCRHMTITRTKKWYGKVNSIQLMR